MRTFNGFNSRKLSAICTESLLMLILFAPIIYMATTGVGYIAELDVKTVNEVTSIIREFTQKIPYIKEWSEEGLSDQKIAEYIKESTSYVTTAGSAGLGFVKNMVLVLIFYFI